MALILSNGGKGRDAGIVNNRLTLLNNILKEIQFENEHRNKVTINLCQYQ